MLFDVIPYPSLNYCRVLTPILYFNLSSSQSNSRHFHFNFSGLFIYHEFYRFFILYYECYGFEWPFFTHRRFLPYTPSFVTQMQAGTPQPGSSSMFAPIESILRPGTWSWTSDIWIIWPLVSWLCQWATKYSVKWILH